MSCYKRIRELREDHDLTQRQLAKLLDMTQTQYFRYEQGYRDLPTDILISLARLYHTSTDYILGLTDDPAAGLNRPESRHTTKRQKGIPSCR